VEFVVGKFKAGKKFNRWLQRIFSANQNGMQIGSPVRFELGCTLRSVFDRSLKLSPGHSAL